ncbi:glycoside hydrolase family 2 protein [Glaciihabitans sp. UYNi722]|uniref:glycoside hydrolase family 2 protein n=1 Tax=Glaciihabitans sp. UYNi722 TaxID=3156344 RepID=UPI003392A204
MRGSIRSGVNLLEVEFDSALEVAEAERDRLGRRPEVYPHPFAMIRKSACNFGWDWGPDIVTAGIWRPIALESWSGTRIDAVRVSARADRTATVSVDLEGDGEFTVSLAGRIVSGRGSVEIAVPEAELWWPRSHGAQPLFEVVVETDGDSLTQRVGFRSVTIDSTDGAFGVRVNGEPVYIRGANWIPDDPFPSNMNRGRYATRITDATEANINLLRVWGGGIYESDDFYAECDERGVLVWQDFLFACAAYPEEQPLWGEVTAEVEDAIDRLASHPSLVVWNGANENFWEYVDFGWAEELGDLTWGEGYYLSLLPGLVARLDPDRPYVPNSPFSWDASHDPNDPSDALVHIWDVWNEVDYTAYAAYSPRFVSEFGFQGPPAWSTLTRAVRDEPLAPDGPELMVHQKAKDGQAKLLRGLAPHLPQPRDFVDWHWATQLNQARAMRFGIHHFRSLAPFNQGTIMWQLNDCWPVVSWSAVDGDGIRKPLWYAMRAAYADRIAIIVGDEVVVINDAPELLDTQMQIGDESVRVRVPARSAVRLPAPAGALVVRGTGVEGDIRLAGEPAEVGLNWPAYQAMAAATPSGYAVTVTAFALTIDLCLLADRLDEAAQVDRGMVSLTPGESITFAVTTEAALDLEALIGIPILRSANDLFR